MDFGIFTSSRLLLTLAAIVVSAIAFAGVANGQPEGQTGKVQQGLVSGQLVSGETQEQYGLLTLGAKCSASLLRNEWAITAAHCVDRPNPDKPGEFITDAENSVTLTANWATEQRQQSMRIISFRPLDVAIIRLANPFSVSGSTRAYNREVFRGTLKNSKITAFGRGIFLLAQGSGTSAMPAQRDGQYRMAVFTIDNEGDDGLYSFLGAGGQMLAGGDSGGPSFIRVGSADLLAGVHSASDLTCLSGKSCSPGNWDWVSSTGRTFDASVPSIWDEIDRYLGAFVPTHLPDGVHPVPRLPPTGAPPRPICDAAREARNRNSSAAPSLEAQCAAFVHSLISRGEALAGQDPLAAQLRNQQPDGPVRRGFDIGMAIAEGQTAPGPGKDKIRDLLPADERQGFIVAVAFSLERNKYADRAAKGAAIAARDSIVAQARNAQTDPFYRLGFDIATAIFGDPALGAQGNTATGPGSLGIRDSLSPAGQRGFNDAVKFHLGRK